MFLLRWLDRISKGDESAKGESKALLFDQLQNIIQQAGSVSRYFWPARPGPDGLHENRASALRDSMTMQEDSPLHNRDLRNSLEHFDERLDRYLADFPVGIFEPDDINYDTPSTDVPLHTFKAFYTVPKVFVLLGVRHQMLPIMNELLRVHSILMFSKAAHYRLSHHK
ncbi:MAG: hypothetical protein Q7T57_02425 [Dehalococcoidales bacterium]|nr:hypothetical protein [Dehalococcoidales bacterium]